MSDSNLLTQAEPTHETQIAKRPMGRWQFSVRGLLVMVLFAAMALALGVTVQRLRRAEAQLDQYRAEYGILQIDDPTTLCAIAQWTTEPKAWRWRVHFPPGRYRVCYATAGLLPDSIPKAEGRMEADFDGLTDVSAAVYRDRSDGDWKCALSAGGARACARVPLTLDNRMSSDSGVRWKQGITRAKTQAPLILLCHRMGKNKPNGDTSLGEWEPTDGLMIWIEYQGNPTGEGTGFW